MGKTVNGKPSITKGDKGGGPGNQIAGMVGGMNRFQNQGGTLQQFQNQNPSQNQGTPAGNVIGQPQPQNDISRLVGAVNQNLGQQSQPQLFQPFQQLPPPPPPQINPAQANPGSQAPPPQQGGGQLDSFFNGNSSLGQVQQMQPFFNGQQSLGQVQQGVPPPSPFGVSPDPGQVEQSKARLMEAFQNGLLSLGQVQAVMQAFGRG